MRFQVTSNETQDLISGINNVWSYTTRVCRLLLCEVVVDSLDGRLITDIERQFLKNWKVMRNRELRLEAPPGISTSSAGLALQSAGTPKVTVSSPGTRQQSMLVVSTRKSTSTPTSTELSMVPCHNTSTKQRLYYDSQLPTFCVCYWLVIFTLSASTLW